jgi:hypothetical protein
MMNDMLKTIQRSRYIFDRDLAEGEKARIKKDLSIGKDETIQAVLDDSAFKNLKQIVALTDKKIYWNTKQAHAELRTGDTKIQTGGPSQIKVADLKTASVFVQNTSSGMVIHIIDGENKWIRITLRWFENDEPLKMLFYYNLSKYCPGYSPNYRVNEERYGAYLKAHRGRTISVIPLIYDIFNHAIIAVLLISLILPRFFPGITFINTEKVVLFSVAVKLLGIIFRYRKSAYMNALLIVTVACSFILPNIFPRIESMWLGYAGLSTLFSVFDFDRVFKYLIIVVVIVSVVALFLQVFFGPLV